MAAYNFARRLKALNGLIPYEYIANLGFIARPIHPQSDPPDAETEHLDLVVNGLMRKI